MTWHWIVGLYVAGIVVWCLVCGYRRDNLGSVLSPFWPIYVPFMVMEWLGGRLRDAVDRRRA